MKKRIAYLIVIASLVSCNVFSQNKADDIIGIWLTGGKEPAKIQIYKSGDPDKSKRNSPIIGLVMLTDFKFDGDDEWKGGDIYDPESGKTYSSFIYLKDNNTIRVRGYVGISLFGRTETWTRTN